MEEDGRGGTVFEGSRGYGVPDAELIVSPGMGFPDGSVTLMFVRMTV